MVKLKPILQSLHLAKYLGFTLVNFETDTYANELGPILIQCHEILASHDDYLISLFLLGGKIIELATVLLENQY
jgi:hypothetical protein